MTNFERKNEPARGSRRGRSGQHITTTATAFFRESVAATRHEKADNLGAELGGHVPEVVLTLPLESKRVSNLSREIVRAQGLSVDAAAGAKLLTLPAVDYEVRRQLADEGRWRGRPRGVVAVDTLTVSRGVLCERGIGELVEGRFSAVVLSLQALVSAVRQQVGEESAELAEAAIAFQDATAAGLVPAIVYVGSTLVVFGGRWPVPQLEGSK